MNMRTIETNVKFLHYYNFWDNFIPFYPVKVLFFAEVCGNFAEAMSIFAVQNISTAFWELPTGCLSDKWGRKWVCRAASFIQLIAFILYATATSYQALFIAAFINGLSFSLSTGNDTALLYDTLVQLKRKDDYHKEISKNIALAQLGLAFGAFAGIGFTYISLRTVMFASIIPTTIALLMTLMLVEPEYKRETSNHAGKHIWRAFGHIYKQKRLRYLALAETIHYGFNEAAFDFNSVFFKQFVPEWTLGIFKGIGHFANSLANYLSFPVAKKIGLKATVLLGAFSDNLINIVSVLVANVFSPIIKTLTAFCNGLKDPALDTLIQEDCSTEERATILSVMSLFGTLFYALCAVFIGFLADISTPYWAMMCAYALALTGNFILIIAFKQQRR